MRAWLDALHHPGAQHGLIHYARIDALQPMVKPTQHLLQKTDLRSGQGKMRIAMRPRTDEALARHLQPLEQAWNGVLIGVRPATDGIHGTLDRRVILAD